MKWLPHKIIDRKAPTYIYLMQNSSTYRAQKEGPPLGAISMDLTVCSTYDNLAPYNIQLREYQKDLKYRLHLRLSKFDRSVFLNLKPISCFFGIYMALSFYLETIAVRQIMIRWLAFEKKPFQFWRKICIQVLCRGKV